MTLSRLDLIAVDIDRALGPSHARAVALIALRAALGAHPSGNPLLQDVMQALESGDWRAAQALRAAVEAMAARLDDEYLELYGAVGNQETPAVIEAFSRARAMEAVAMALGPDETMAAKEALYEAHASLSATAGEELLASVRKALAKA